MDRLISEKSVMEVIYGCDWFIDEEHAEVIKERIKAIPSAEPKTGHWILKRTFPTKLYDEYLNEYKCSECDRGIRCTENQLVNYPYCHCGAKMVDPQESEDKE